MSDEKKATDGNYVVLQVIDDTDPEAPVLRKLGSWRAHRPEEALKLAASTDALVGTFVVMPARGWRVFAAEPTTVMQVKAVE